MPELNPRPFRNEPNATIMNAIRGIASNDYQRRVPAATQANVQDAIAEMMNYTPSRNEFLNHLVNAVGTTIARTNTWSNPLAIFKRGMLQYGESIEEVMTGLVRARTYDPNRDYLERDIFGQETPEVQASYHKINREEYYKITVNHDMLRRAFASDTGLSGLAAQIMQSPTTSDAWDEYLLMTSMFKEFDAYNGFHKVAIGDVASGSGGASVSTALVEIRAMTKTLGFPSRKYNAAHMPVSAQPNELMLITTPKFEARIDVDALAGAFHMDKADINSRIVIVREEDIPVPGFQAILTTPDIFVVADTLLETRSQPNPVGLYDNFFLHHHGIYSLSRFTPAVMFTAEESTPIEVISTPIDGITAITVADAEGDAAAAVEAGKYYQAVVTATSTASVDGVPPVLNNGANIDWSGAESPRSFIRNDGTFYIAQDETSTEITITASSTDNPEITATPLVLTNTPGTTIWPVPEPEEEEPPVDPEA